MVENNEKKVLKVVNHATSWAASTHKFFLEFLKDIKELKSLVSQHAKKSLVVGELSEAMRHFWRAARSESKLKRFTDKLEEFKLDELYPSKEAMAILGTDLSSLNLSQLAEVGKQIQEIKSRINVEGRHLVRMASFFEGGMRNNLNEIEALADQYEKLRGDKNEWELRGEEEKKLSLVEEQIKFKLEELSKIVSEADKWASALSSDLISAKKVYTDFRIKQVAPEKISEIIAKYNSPYDKIEHLGLFLKSKAREAFSTSVNRKVKRLIGLIISRNNNAYLSLEAAKIYERAEMADDAKKYAKKAFDLAKAKGKSQESYAELEKAAFYLRFLGEHIDAGDCFIEMARNMFKMSGARGADWGYKEAAEEYNKAGRKGYKDVGIMLMKFGREEQKNADYYGDLAISIFKEGRFFELEGDVWFEKAEDKVPKLEIVKGYCENAIIAFEKAGKNKKISKVRDLWRKRAVRYNEYWSRVREPTLRRAPLATELRV